MLREFWNRCFGMLDEVEKPVEHSEQPMIPGYPSVRTWIADDGRKKFAVRMSARSPEVELPPERIIEFQTEWNRRMLMDGEVFHDSNGRFRDDKGRLTDIPKALPNHDITDSLVISRASVLAVMDKYIAAYANGVCQQDDVVAEVLDDAVREIRDLHTCEDLQDASADYDYDSSCEIEIPQSEQGEPEATEPTDADRTRTALAERLKRDGIAIPSHDEQIALGICPPGWKATQFPLPEMPVSLTVEMTIDGASTTHTVTGIRYDQLAETLMTIRGGSQ